MNIWFDVTDLVEFFQHAQRPTGIQRLHFETCQAVWDLAGETREITFCHRAGGGTLQPIHFPALAAGIRATAAAPAALPPATPPNRARAPELPALARLARRLPQHYRLPLGRLARAAAATGAAARDLALAALPRRAPAHPLRGDLRGGGLRGGGLRIGGHQFDLTGPEAAPGPGDWLVHLGASWHLPYPPAYLARLQAQGTRLALLAYDLLPQLHPEWFDAGVAADFSYWLENLVPRADLVFAISRHTARDLEACMGRLGRRIAPPEVLPIGQSALPACGPPLLAGPYVLMVGTLEPRKNHAAMFRVWRRLLSALPAAQVPTLVFAGKQGWLTDDLMRQLNNAGWLGAKILHWASPSEAELANLYKHCQFSVFPSLYEGFGLPVLESLAHGKMVAASNSAAIPEAGGDFCAYYDPENISEMFEVILGLITRPERLAGAQARIAREFVPPSWADTARALLDRLGLAISTRCSAGSEADLAAQRS